MDEKLINSILIKLKELTKNLDIIVNQNKTIQDEIKSINIQIKLIDKNQSKMDIRLTSVETQLENKTIPKGEIRLVIIESKLDEIKTWIKNYDEREHSRNQTNATRNWALWFLLIGTALSSTAALLIKLLGE